MLRLSIKDDMKTSGDIWDCERTIFRAHWYFGVALFGRWVKFVYVNLSIDRRESMHGDLVRKDGQVIGSNVCWEKEKERRLYVIVGNIRFSLPWPCA